MKQIILSAVATLCIALFVALGCTKQNNDIKLPFCGDNVCLKADLSGGMFSCEFVSFLESATPWFVYDSAEDAEGRLIQPHVIIAEVLEETYSSGRRIRVVEDLVGNFPKDVSTLMVWGGINVLANLACSDCYKTGSTVIITLHLGVHSGIVLLDQNPTFNPRHEWVLASHHSLLAMCAKSVLWFKDGFVLGDISISPPLIIGSSGALERPLGNSTVTRKMSLRDFRRELNNVLQKIN